MMLTVSIGANAGLEHLIGMNIFSDSNHQYIIVS